ncbi:MAG: Hpt domain-containing protein [Oscillospiraceae bacterium]|nr:Hpt domain-containing protein [Oscillospiraceae bacterium]
MSFVKEEYIDVQDALKRIGGNVDLYKRLLGRFVDGDQLKQLEAALDSGNKEDASRLAHTIKGVAANLSLVKLREVSADLEQNIIGDHDHTAKLNELKDVYDVTVQIASETIT